MTSTEQSGSVDDLIHRFLECLDDLCGGQRPAYARPDWLPEEYQDRSLWDVCSHRRLITYAAKSLNPDEVGYGVPEGIQCLGITTEGHAWLAERRLKQAHSRKGEDRKQTREKDEDGRLQEDGFGDVRALEDRKELIRLTEAASTFDIPKSTLSRLSRESRPGRPRLKRFEEDGKVYLVRGELRRLQLSRTSGRRKR